jgi:glycosyltransferase involved in cell wall biosynthesis
MRVLHLAAGNRWTGAAAPAFAEVEALREAGVDAHYAYVGGYKLQQKLAHHDFAHPLIEKAQNPFSFRRTTDAIDRLVRLHRFDIVHAHLTYDHLIARLVASDRDVRIARTYHARRVLRNDPISRSMLRRTDHVFVVNDAFRDDRALRGRDVVFTPPPVDHRQFHPSGPAISSSSKLVTVIGKLAPRRGFEDALRTYAALRRLRTDADLMIIGHGGHRPVLEQLAASLGIAEHVLWAGYHEDDLAEHYRASSALLFTARGSDEGHRAILEAMACGVPPASYPIEGVSALLPPEHIAPDSSPEALAAVVAALLDRPLREAMHERSLEFGYDRAARRLIEAYLT